MVQGGSIVHYEKSSIIKLEKWLKNGYTVLTFLEHYEENNTKNITVLLGAGGSL